MKSSSEVERFVSSILPEPGIRQKCLAVFADAIDEADRCGRDRWAVTRTAEKVRLIVGHVIVCTLRDRPERGPIWMALDEELLGTSDRKSILERSGDWEWDVDQYPEYSTIQARNGYYSPSEKHAELWPTIRRLHFESIRRAADHRAIDPRTRKGHSPEILRYIEKELGRRLPDPQHPAQGPSGRPAGEPDRLPRTAAPPPAFEVGRVYDRRRDIHGPYGGSWQSGIAPSAGWPLVFLFTGQSGERYGYEDRWTEEGVFMYTGEGQVGDMEFARGNRVVRDHAEEGRDLHLFEALGKGEGCRYLGAFACPTYELRRGPDRDRHDRRVIVFHLVQQTGAQPHEPPPDPSPTDVPADRLREEAYVAASEAAESAPREAKRLYHRRSAAVRGYVLARAAGTCEACGSPAPFERPDGTPYLEPHHTRRLSDGGPDHPRWVAAVCPNCHREVHHGAGGEEKNRALQERLGALEY